MTNRIGVIIPTFNRADLLPGAVDSVLAQSVADVEAIVIDDASTDDTQAVLERYRDEPRVRVLRNATNAGIARSRNAGIAASTAPFIAMLDSDDLWLDRDKLAAQLDVLQRDPRCALVGTDAIVIDRRGRDVGSIRNLGSDRAIRSTLFIKNQFVNSSVLIRRTALDDVGLFDVDIPLMEDYELWLRIARRHGVANLRRPMTGYRVHDGNVSRGNPRAGVEALRRLHAAYRGSFPWPWVLKLRMARERLAVMRTPNAPLRATTIR